jgi:SAM-dependent methyltransferase
MNAAGKFLNFIALPIRLIFSHETINKMGLKSLRDERYDIVRKNLRGRLIDIGCGNNALVKSYGNNSVGVDVFDFGGDAMIVEDASSLPFEEKSFQSASFVACLNHITNREEVLRETSRLLTDNGRVYMTMLTPVTGYVRHKLAWWDPDQHDRGMKSEEKMGLSHQYLVDLFSRCGFRLVKRQRFILGLNNFYVFEKG